MSSCGPHSDELWWWSNMPVGFLFFWFRCRDNRATVWVSAFLLRSQMSDPAPTIAPSQKSRSGISWMGWNWPQGSVYLVSSFFLKHFLWPFFSPPLSFFSWAFVFWVPPSLNPIFFLGTRTYSSNLPSTTQPIYLPPSLPFALTFPQCSSCHHHCKRSLGGGQEELLSLCKRRK